VAQFEARETNARGIGMRLMTAAVIGPLLHRRSPGRQPDVVVQAVRNVREASRAFCLLARHLRRRRRVAGRPPSSTSLPVSASTTGLRCIWPSSPACASTSAPGPTSPERPPKATPSSRSSAASSATSPARSTTSATLRSPAQQRRLEPLPDADVGCRAWIEAPNAHWRRRGRGSPGSLLHLVQLPAAVE
jgi:hypothetical protein